MATAYKVLGQVNPALDTATALYTVAADTEAVISTIVICNQAAADATFRISVRPDGAALVAKHYLAFDVTVGASDSTTLTLGITLDATDVLEVYASTATVSFNAFGSEITA
jgi:hypothetical protein